MVNGGGKLRRQGFREELKILRSFVGNGGFRLGWVGLGRMTYRLAVAAERTNERCNESGRRRVRGGLWKVEGGEQLVRVGLGWSRGIRICLVGGCG